MSHLAVIQTANQPYKLVKEINGKYFEIEKIDSLSDALTLRLSEFRKAFDAAGSKEVTGKLVAPVAADTEVWGAGIPLSSLRASRERW